MCLRLQQREMKPSAFNFSEGNRVHKMSASEKFHRPASRQNPRYFGPVADTLTLRHRVSCLRGAVYKGYAFHSVGSGFILSGEKGF